MLQLTASETLERAIKIGKTGVELSRNAFVFKLGDRGANVGN